MWLFFTAALMKGSYNPFLETLEATCGQAETVLGSAEITGVGAGARSGGWGPDAVLTQQ